MTQNIQKPEFASTRLLTRASSGWNIRIHTTTLCPEVDRKQTRNQPEQPRECGISTVYLAHCVTGCSGLVFENGAVLKVTIAGYGPYCIRTGWKSR